MTRTEIAMGEYVVGRAICGIFRNFLERLKFHGHQIEYLEGGGWLTRIFSVKTTMENHALIKKTFLKKGSE